MPEAGSRSDAHARATAEPYSVTTYIYVITLLIYIFTAKGYIQISDTFTSLATAESLVARGRLDIPHSEGATLTGPDGRSYSKYGIGLALYYVPLVAAGEFVFRITGFPSRDLAGFLISFAGIPFAILLLWLFARLLRHFGVGGHVTNLLVATLGLGTLCWHYAVSDFSEMMQAAMLLAAVVGIVERTRRGTVVGGLAFAGLVLVKLVHAALLPAFMAYLIAPGRPLKMRLNAVVHFFVPVACAFALLVGLNLVRFGNPLESGYGGEAAQFIPSQLWWTVPRLLFSFDKGLFFLCPVLVFGLLGWGRFSRRYRPEALLSAAIILCSLLLAGAWHSWVGGWSWGPRLLVPTIPFWLLPAAFWLEAGRSTIRRSLFVFAAGFSMAWQVPGVLVKDQEIHHIKDILLPPEDRDASPCDLAAAWHLLRSKLARIDGPEVYRASEFGAHEDRELDLTQYQTFQGHNVWTEHTSRRLRMRQLRWLPIAAVLVGAYCAIRARRKLVGGNSDTRT